jgi:hypothetical protein
MERWAIAIKDRKALFTASSFGKTAATIVDPEKQTVV